VEDIIDFLEIEPYRKRIVGTLPYGLRKRVDLGRALAMEPRLLLVDEPLAGMNRDEKEDIARFILDIAEERGVTILVVEHDMGLVMDIADRVVVLDFGRKIAEGDPEEIRHNEEVIKAYLGKAY
jgi:branched-chain amino acid transport system ATP-binding protein